MAPNLAREREICRFAPEQGRPQAGFPKPPSPCPRVPESRSRIVRRFGHLCKRSFANTLLICKTGPEEVATDMTWPKARKRAVAGRLIGYAWSQRRKRAPICNSSVVPAGVLCQAGRSMRQRRGSSSNTTRRLAGRHAETIFGSSLFSSKASRAGPGGRDGSEYAVHRLCRHKLSLAGRGRGSEQLSGSGPAARASTTDPGKD